MNEEISQLLLRDLVALVGDEELFRLRVRALKRDQTILAEFLERIIKEREKRAENPLMPN